MKTTAKRLFLFTCGLWLAFFAQAQTTVATTAGNLSTDLQTVIGSATLNSVTNLKVTGTLNATDMALFGTYGANGLRNLVTLDLGDVTAIENKTIPDNAFYQLSALTTVTLPDGGVITYIGVQAFASASKLKSVNIPEGVTTIGNAAFYSTPITDVVLPNSITTLGERVFSFCSSIKNVTLPGTITEIPRSTFQNCSSLTTLTLPASVKTIGAQAFQGTSQLKDLKLPDGLEWLDGNQTFKRSGITKLEIPASTKIIDGYLYSTFEEAPNLTAVNIPANVTTLGDGTFSYCPITSVIIPEGVTTIGNYPFVGSSLTNLVIPNTVTSVGSWIFGSNGNDLVTAVKLGTGVTTLGEGAFMNLSKVESLELPAGLIKIGESAFSGMTGLKKIIVNNPEPVIFTTQTQVFNGIDKSTAVLYVPAGKGNDYKDFDLWKTFTNIRQIGSDAIAGEISSFDNITVETGASLITLAATATGNRPITYSIESGKQNVATLQGNVLTITGEGTAQVTAKANGDNNYQETTKAITLTVVGFSYLEEATIFVNGNTAKVVGPTAATTKFTKFYVNDTEVTFTGGIADLTGKTGELSLKAATADGTEVIKLKINK